MKKIFLLCFLISSLAFGADHLMYAPSGNLVLDAKVGSVVKVNKTLRVDNITNLAGTSGTPGMVPVGGLVAVMPNTHANAWQPPATGAIKDGFMRADGAVVPTCADCVIPAGTATPNMVTRFLKGSTTSGTTAGSPTKNLPAHYHAMGAGSTLSVDINHDHGAQSFGSGNNSVDHSHSGTTGNGNLASVNGVILGHNDGISLDWDNYSITRGTSVLQGSGGNGNFPGRLHTHGFSTGGVSVNHSHTTSVDLSALGATAKTPTGLIGLGSGSGGCDGNSGSSCSINVEPAYMETVWIIRVK